jgi:PD-(D/E)XK nuclease superfamily
MTLDLSGMGGVELVTAPSGSQALLNGHAHDPLPFIRWDQQTGKRIVRIHTSDRILYRRCRRRWNWASPTRGFLEGRGSPPAPLWLGTGFHFALEDFHGWNIFGDPVKAINAYAQSFRPDELPEDYIENVELGRSMLHYYELWYPRRSEFDTLWLNDPITGEPVPQVEVEFEIPLYELWGSYEGVETEVYYVGAFDRVCVDAFGRLWITDYKTAKRIDTNKLETDPQITAYSWAGSKLYADGLVEGVLYIQFAKQQSDTVTVLKDGNLSQNKQIATTYALYREALVERFGTVPPQYVNHLNYLSSQETAEGDMFIKRSLVRRNQHAIAMEEQKILAEVSEMILPSLPLYPNPIRDCFWDCSFRDPCLAMDDGSDYQYLVNTMYQPRQKIPAWRQRVKWPAVPPTLTLNKRNRIDVSMDERGF